jgi:hypothetical protein
MAELCNLANYSYRYSIEKAVRFVALTSTLHRCHIENRTQQSAMRDSASPTLLIFRRLFSFCIDHWQGLERQDVA